jgi:predicted nucleic acid-binding Zn ribbon protein
MPTTSMERDESGEECLTARCRACRDPFWINRPWQNYCSERCRRRMEKRRERLKAKKAAVATLPVVVGISSRERELLDTRPSPPPRRPSGRLQAVFDPSQYDTIVGFVDRNGNDVPEQFWPARSQWPRYL